MKPVDLHCIDRVSIKIKIASLWRGYLIELKPRSLLKPIFLSHRVMKTILLKQLTRFMLPININ